VLPLGTGAVEVTRPDLKRSQPVDQDQNEDTAQQTDGSLPANMAHFNPHGSVFVI
jgi:hypothetical protein